MGTAGEVPDRRYVEQRQETWEPLHIENSGWQDAAFTLDDDEAPLLVAGGSAGAADGGAAASLPEQQRLHRKVSKFTLATEEQEEGWLVYRHEMGRIMDLALPMTVSQFVTFALNLVSVAFIGRLSEEKMAVAVLATSLMNVTGYSLVLGLLGAMDTLCGQAWGAKNYRALGVTLQKAIITTLATTAGVCLLWANIRPLLLAVGQDETIARGAARFLFLAMPALLISGLFECFKRYLMAQGVVRPVTAVSCAALSLSPLLNWFFIFFLGWGIDGAVAAMIGCNASMLAMLSCYVAWRERRRRGLPEQTWHGWSRECLKGLGAYYRLAVPSTLMVCLEWWAYEFCIFISGWLPQPHLQVSAMGIMLQVSGLAYMLPMGLSCATSVRVSNALGAGLPRSARRSALTATAMTACTQLVLVLAINLGRRRIGQLFTNIPEVVLLCAATFPLMSASMFGDGLNCVISGVLRGAGRQELGALLNLTSYWGLGLPSSYLLAVHVGLQLRGLWGGLIIATSVQGVIMLVVLYRFKWQREAERAAELLAASGGGGEAPAHGCGAVGCEDSAGKLYAGGAAEKRVGTAADVEHQ